MALFDNSRYEKKTSELAPMIEEYLANGGTIKEFPPAAASGNEQAKSTHREIMKKRAAWRQEQRDLKKGNVVKVKLDKAAQLRKEIEQ